MDDNVYSVSQLTAELRGALERGFPLLRVEGEVSNLSAPRSGHLYFTLKDQHAQIRCAWFRNKRMLSRYAPQDGDQVLVRARISLFEPRGDLQLLIESVEPSGAGALQLAFEQLKAKLQQEGLFDQQRKKPLPTFPRRIGLVTSPTGAVIRDMLHVLKRRCPCIEVLVFPVPVQGANAVAEICEALRLADARSDCDLLILARGGGSLEDLAAFNDEAVARTLASLRIPVIAAIGHETDFSIADFVADRRAPTPSAAAELASPLARDLSNRFGELAQRLLRALRGSLRQHTQRLEHLARQQRLLHPLTRLRREQQRLDQLTLQLERAMQSSLAERRGARQQLLARLNAVSPARRIQSAEERRQRAVQGLQRALRLLLKGRRDNLAGLSGQLHALSPLATLARGYSITRDSAGRVLTDPHSVRPGARLYTQLAQGRIESEVIETGD